MGLWDRIKVRLGLGDDFDEEYDEYYDEDEPAADDEYERHRAYPRYTKDASPVRRLDRGPDLERARDASPLRPVPPEASGFRPSDVSAPQVKMHISEPRSFTEAQTIADKFKAGTPVIMNLSTANAELSKRMIDFASGLTYGLDGGLQKVAEKVFMLTPANVSVSAEDRRRLKDKGLFSVDG